MIAVSNENLPTVMLLCGDVPIKENRNSLQGEIFDGIELSVRLVMMTVMVNVGSKVRTVNISPVRCNNVYTLVHVVATLHTIVNAMLCMWLDVLTIPVCMFDEDN